MDQDKTEFGDKFELVNNNAQNAFWGCEDAIQIGSLDTNIFFRLN